MAYGRAVMRTSWFLVAVAVSLVAATAPARATYHPLEELPVESRVIRDIEDLAATYGFGGAFHTTRPWDLVDLGAFLDEVLTLAPQAEGDPAVTRLRRELLPQAGDWGPLIRARDDQTSLEVSPYLRADYAEDRAHQAISRDFRGGVQASALLGRGVLLFTDVYAGTNSAGPHGNPVESRHFGLIEGVEVNPYFDRAYLRARGALGTVTLGHSWLRWGPGVTGGVGLSDGSPAYDFAEFRTRFLRRLQLEWFVATLDPVTGSYLAGHRIEVRPGASLDLALSELARFDGVANAPLYLLPVIPYSLIERRVIRTSDLPADSLAGTSQNNVMWVADFTWRARPGARLYGELAVDDISFSSEPRPLSIAWLTGVHGRWRQGGGALSARGEYARVYRYTYSSYHHQDFAFHGLPTGYPLGPDAEQFFGQLAWARSTDWTFTLEGAVVRKGELELGDSYVLDSPRPPLALSGVVEQDARVAASVDWSPAGGLMLGLTAGDARVLAPDHVAGRRASGFYGATRCRVRW
jgi:hypothetical protein